MKYQLEQLFMEGEQERIQKENQEKKEAEQIAAGTFICICHHQHPSPPLTDPSLHHHPFHYCISDLSLMAGTVDSFDTDFSFGNVFSPLNSGVTWHISVFLVHVLYHNDSCHLYNQICSIILPSCLYNYLHVILHQFNLLYICSWIIYSRCAV